MLRWYEPVWLAFFASAALKSTVVLALAWAVTKLLRGRSAAARHLVWTAAAAAVLALPFLSLGLPELRLPVNLPGLTFQTTVADSGAENALEAAGLQSSAATQPGKSAPWHADWPLYWMALWAAGTAVALAQMALAARAMVSARARARRYAAEDFSRLADELDMPRGVPVLEAAPGSMPMTFGLWRPAIFLPADAAQWSDERRRMVVLHELAHVRRGDVAAHLLARAALCFYWWNPLAWMAWREFLKEREHATDDLVLRTGARASDYAAHLLDVARAMQPAPAIGWAAVAMARRSQLEGRLLAILDSSVNRRAIERATMAAVAVAAVALMAPLAAMHAQDPNDAAVPADVDATIRAALAQKNHEILDNAAAAFMKIRQYETAQKLLETSLQVREQTSGQQSAEYGEGLAKLGDLAVRKHQNGEAIDFYNRAALAIGDRPAATHPLFELGVLMMGQKDYTAAEQDFQRMQNADPSKAGEALTWIALTHERQEGGAPIAESYYRQALNMEDSTSPEAAVTTRLLARLLNEQGRGDEANLLLGTANGGQAQPQGQLTLRVGGPAGQAQAATTATVQPKMSPGAVRVGAGIKPPTLAYKVEPEYTEVARAAKYQGTVLLYVEVGPDGLAHNIQVTRSLGLGLDQQAVEAVSQWKFNPGSKDGQPVTVAATIEVNFRLL
jgi:TonB family protein